MLYLAQMNRGPETGWSPASWRSRPLRQLPAYEDSALLETVEAQLAGGPGVVALEDAASLRELTSRAVRERGFILQGGDCAESLGDDPERSADMLADLFDRLATPLDSATEGPLVRIARAAGQFAKPRSSSMEERGDDTLPSYRGDMINDADFSASARSPDPQRLVAAFNHSKASATAFAARSGGNGRIFTSHEALHLYYEQALLRKDDGGRWWSASAHMLWLGERTREVDGAHTEFLSGIENVVGVKCGPTMDADDLKRLAAKLDPDNRAGKLIFIGRFGASRIGEVLPPLLEATRSEGLSAAWMIDPMHGNTVREDGRKVRRIEDIAGETGAFFDICDAERVHPAGLHLEMTPLEVTECGPPDGVLFPYLSPCDPRLNGDQAAVLCKLAATRLLDILEPAA